MLTRVADYSGSSGGFRDTQRSGGFEEYDAGGDEDTSTSPRRSTSTSQRTGGSSRRTTAPTASAPAPKPKEPEVDLLGGFDEDIPSSATSNSFATNKELPALSTPAAPVALADGEFLLMFTVQYRRPKLCYFQTMISPTFKQHQLQPLQLLHNPISWRCSAQHQCRHHDQPFLRHPPGTTMLTCSVC